MMHYFFLRTIPYVRHTNLMNGNTSKILFGDHGMPIIYVIQNQHRYYKSADVTGVAFSPLPDAEVKIQLYYKKQEIKKRREKLIEVAKLIWKKNPNVNYSRITLDECKTMYEEQTGRVPSLWEAKQIYRSVISLLHRMGLD